MDQKYNLLAIIGPTASGKTDLAIRLAKRLNGEIICADSRTVYKYLDIGTAKPSFYEQQEVKHWCIDIVEPDEQFSAADFKRAANLAISDIRSRGKLPIVVGGSGLYVDGLLYDFDFGQKADIRKRCELETKTIPELQQEINQSGLNMPTNQKNKRHLIRTIELAGTKQKRNNLSIDTLLVGLDVDNTTLKKRIGQRILKMLDMGLMDEAMRNGTKYPKDIPAFSSNIYKLTFDLLDGLLSDDIFLQQATNKDYQLAKRQKTWFRRNKDINWVSPSEAETFVVQKMLSVLK